MENMHPLKLKVIFSFSSLVGNALSFFLFKNDARVLQYERNLKELDMIRELREESLFLCDYNMINYNM